MFDRVIAGVDGREGGHDAIALATALSSASVTLVGAYPADEVRSRASLAAYERLLREDCERTLEEARSAAGIEADLLAVPDSSPARALQRTAEERSADLIVVGSSRHGALGRLMLGDVARGVLHRAPCAVAVAPRGHRGAEPRTIAVGFDGSPESRVALDLAQRLAADRSAALSVFVVWEDPPTPVAEVAWVNVSELRDETHTAADRLLEEALAELPPATAEEVLKGRPDVALADASAACDVVIVGSRGWGPVKRLALGSTSDRLVHESTTPVIVVPRPSE